MGANLRDLRDLPPTVALWPTTGQILGMGRSKTYELAKLNEFPIRLLHIGNTYRVARADLLRYLGEIPSEPV